MDLAKYTPFLLSRVFSLAAGSWYTQKIAFCDNQNNIRCMVLIALCRQNECMYYICDRLKENRNNDVRSPSFFGLRLNENKPESNGKNINPLIIIQPISRIK